MSLKNFFRNPSNYVTRERMFFNKLYFDLKLAAARAGVPLQVFVPEVDRDGFDVVIDDYDLEKRFQLKSFLRSARTVAWNIHKRLLRPQIDHIQALGFEQSPEGVGLEGGVILIEIDDADESCPVTYYYTDIQVITVLADGFIACAKTRRDQALNVLRRLHRGVGTSRVSLPSTTVAFLILREESAAI